MKRGSGRECCDLEKGGEVCCFQDPLSNSAPFNCTQLQKSFLVWNYSAALKCEIFYYV